MTKNFIKVTKHSKPAQVFYLPNKNKIVQHTLYRWRKKNNTEQCQFSTEFVDERPNDPVAWEVQNAELLAFLENDIRSVHTRSIYINHLKRYTKLYRNTDDIDTIKEHQSNLVGSQKEAFLYAVIKANKFKGNMELVNRLVEMGKVVRGVNKITKIEKMNKPNDKEILLTYDDVQKIAKEYPKENRTEKFIAELYAVVAWRGPTVINMSKDRKASNENIIRLVKKEIEMNNFKNVRMYGKKVTSISPQLCSLFRKHFLYHRHADLLPGMTLADLKKIVQKIFKVGIRELRHIHLTHGRKTLDNEGFVNLCMMMNTSAETGLLVYNDTKA